MTTEKKKAKSEQPAEIDFESIASLNSQALDAYGQATQAMLRGVAAINEELMSFANAQMRDSMRAGQAMMGCEDFTEAVRLQIGATHTASERYFSEAGRLLELTAKMAREYSTPLENRAREVMEGVQAANRK